MRLKTLAAAAVAAALAAGAVATPAAAAPAAPGRDPLAGAVNLPPGGTVDFILGQDGGTLADFRAAVLDADPGHPEPSGVSLFASVNGITPLNGLWSPVDYRVGRTDFEEVLSEYGGALTIGLELIDYSQDLGTDGRNLGLRAIAGDPDVDAATVERYRGWVDELIRYADATKREVFLKIGYEFDGHWNNYDPEAYTAAFRWIAERIDELGADRVATVWQTATWAAAIPEKTVVGADAYAAGVAVRDGASDAFWDAWYPGDDVVDWMGVSRFAAETAEDPGRPWSCDRGPDGAPDTTVIAPRAVQDAFLDYARDHAKPVMIAESAPQGYDLGEGTVSCIFASGSPAPYEQVTPVSSDEIWDEWFQPLFDFVRENRDVVRSVTYINTDWDSQGNWACTGAGACNAGYWGDSRLQADAEILDRVRAELSDARVWNRGPAGGSAFTAPDFSEGAGVYEAEYAEASTWLDCCGLGGLPQVASTASNGREVMVMNFGDGGAGTYGVTFEDVRRGDGVTVRLNSLRDGFENSDATFSLLVDGERVGAPVLVPKLASGSYAEVEFDVAVPNGADVTVQLDPNTGGNLIWLDRIVVG
ncbi:hypothetical protein ARHIZOSPH14_11680 [Agromyces rhizosphaerae]|uniref:GH26 domain-containing protein n=1 Tax=Agromyces rhizosphaerae TaxID=88374 RepID=A0A9W6FNW5_9MICO|nr:hypothetical protein [Agromyces rhizosphaerae]GLI26926.1 hypothetical protein ARHIZOSPH14_11680 [Agromyces rhizosphaerae]